MLQFLRRSWTVYGILFLSVLVFQTVAYQFSPLYYEPSSPDASFFIDVGRAWHQGIIPYLDIPDPKGPAFFEIFALLEMIGLNSYSGLFMLCFAINCIAILFVHRTCLLFYSQSVSMLIAVVCQAFLLTVYIGKVSICAELLILPLLAVPYFYLIAFWEGKKDITFVDSIIVGFLGSLWFWSKFSLIFILVFPALFLIFSGIRNAFRHDFRCLKICLWTLISFIMSSIIWMIPLLCSGNFGQMIKVYFGGVTENKHVGWKSEQFLETLLGMNFFESWYVLAKVIFFIYAGAFVLFWLARLYSVQTKIWLTVSYAVTAFLSNFYVGGPTTLTFQMLIIFFTIGAMGIITTARIKPIVRKVSVGFVAIVLIGLFSFQMYNKNNRDFTLRIDKDVDMSRHMVQNFEVVFARTTPAYYFCFMSDLSFSDDIVAYAGFTLASEMNYYCQNGYESLIYASKNNYYGIIKNNGLRDSAIAEFRMYILREKPKQVVMELADLSNFEQDEKMVFLKNNSYRPKEVFQSTFYPLNEGYSILFELDE